MQVIRDLDGGSLAAILEEMLADGGEQDIDALLEEWGFGIEVGDLIARYRLYPESPFNPSLVAWLLSRHDAGSPADFEARLGARIGKMGVVLTPLWVLAIPVALGGVHRLPADPVICPTAPEIEIAYRGLVEHLRAYQHLDSLELQRSAIIWRVAALVDGLEPTDDFDPHRLAMRLGRVRFRLKTDARLSELEQSICTRWEDDPFADRRNTLSHLRGRDLTFEQVCAFYRDGEAMLVVESQAICLAVLREAAEAMREETPPQGIVERAYADVSWIEP